MKKSNWIRYTLVALGALLLGSGTLLATTDIAVNDTPPEQTASFWQTDFAAAQNEAKESKKPILLVFSGSDWCGWCIKLDEEVFSQKDFQEWARANVIPVMVDFPQAKPQPAKLIRQNSRLEKIYQIEGFPTVLLVDASGKELARTGYKKGGAAKYIDHLKKLMGK